MPRRTAVRHITLPLLNPVIVYLTVLSTISFLRLFALVQNMSPPGHGGTAEEHDHRRAGGVPEGVFSYDMGYAAAPLPWFCSL